MTVTALIRAGETHPTQPWPRYLLTPEAWRAMAHALASDPEPAFLGLWADNDHVYALFMADAPLLASVRVESGMFDALSPARPAAAPFERMVHDLWGHLAGNGIDPRPLLDQGRWPVLRPLAARPTPNAASPEPQEFLGAAGHGLHQVSLGPIGAPAGGAMDPVHLRITASGETVMRLETGLGYAHRGLLAVMHGKPLGAAAALAARIDACCTVAHAVAFARATEAAAAIEPPPRAQALRCVMAELERIGSHLADLGAVASARTAARCGDLREGVLRACHAAFGHRLMMDCVVPGGIAQDLAPPGLAVLRAMLDRIAAAGPALRREFAGITRRTGGVGIISGGSDVAARLRLRLAELQGSVVSLRSLLARLPPGPLDVAVPPATGEGLGVANGPRGDVWHWLRIDAGCIAANFARDPGWLHLATIEDACRDCRVSDVPLILRSINPALGGLEL